MLFKRLFLENIAQKAKKSIPILLKEQKGELCFERKKEHEPCFLNQSHTLQ